MSLQLNGTDGVTFNDGSEQWAAASPIGPKNLIINGDMRISQRGTSFTSNLENTYTLDRWKIHDRLCTSRSVTQESFSTGSISTFGKEVSNYLRATFSNDSGATPPFVMQAIEDVKSVAGETVTISFWAKADSAQNITLNYSQQFGSGGSSEVTAIIDTFTLTTSWAKYTATVTIPSISGKTVGTSSYLRIDWRMPANTAITYDMTLVQLEVGDTATPFEVMPYDMQLQRCKRYYETTFSYGTAIGTATAAGAVFTHGNNISPTGSYISTNSHHYSVEKRATPTLTTWDEAGNQGVCGRVQLGLSTSQNENIYIALSTPKGFFGWSTSGASRTGVIFHFTAEAEL